jgi:hypothetical protein
MPKTQQHKPLLLLLLPPPPPLLLLLLNQPMRQQWRNWRGSRRRTRA